MLTAPGGHFMRRREFSTLIGGAGALAASGSRTGFGRRYTEGRYPLAGAGCPTIPTNGLVHSGIKGLRLYPWTECVRRASLWSKRRPGAFGIRK